MTEFKELRKQFRKRKREQAALLANANASVQYAAWTRGSMSSESDYSRRDSFASAPRYSMDSDMYGSRPNTASSMSSVSSGYGNSSYAYDYSQAPLQQQQQQAQPQSHMAPGQMGGMINNARRDSAPQHIPLPTSANMGFRQNQDGPTPTQQNPFPSLSANGIPPMNVHTNRQAAPATTGYPFEALTMPAGPAMGQQPYQQFAFQQR
jgi:hypothetical protein